MPANADVVKVTDVQLKPTADGLEVILETASRASPQPKTSSENQTLLIDLSNAQLNLRGGGEFHSENPVEGITFCNSNFPVC
ncbi:AMIN domain-containing protein [Allocoleopsis franciscana]|uniref:AMIN domain-containing protein n=1 Tax=Allocoleopsis franciscana TaxID=2886352 RepID=UPI0005A249F7|nr:AMIN domain-containing protein [Allocoleopsis franciscana]